MRSVEVTQDYDPAGVWCLRIHKKRGKFTLDEIIDACREYEEDFYMISIKAMDVDMDQYYLTDDFEGDYVTVYRAGDFFEWRERSFSRGQENDLISRQETIEAADKIIERDTSGSNVVVNGVPSAQPEITDGQAIEHLQASGWMQNHDKQMYEMGLRERLADDSDNYDALLPVTQPEPKKYEYHYDHTDCIWYRPEARNRCPTTCAQYRDGWNDAMNYIFRDGKGYRPYRRDEQYGE